MTVGSASAQSSAPDRGADEAAAAVWREQLRGVARATPARLLVLQTLAAADEHLTIAQIHERVCRTQGRVNLSTVYRTVERLEELGLVHQLFAQGVARYGPLDHPHHHAVCRSCERVIELEPHDVADALSLLESRTSVHPDRNSSLTVQVTCNACRDPTQTTIVAFELEIVSRRTAPTKATAQPARSDTQGLPRSARADPQMAN